MDLFQNIERFKIMYLTYQLHITFFLLHYSLKHNYIKFYTIHMFLIKFIVNCRTIIFHFKL
jgi:high-affinity nickel permease